MPAERIELALKEFDKDQFNQMLSDFATGVEVLSVKLDEGPMVVILKTNACPYIFDLPNAQKIADCLVGGTDDWNG